MSEQLAKIQDLPAIAAQKRLDAAKEVCTTLMRFVDQAGIAKIFRKGDKPHLQVEAWQFIGQVYRIYPTIEEAIYIEDDKGKVIGARARVTLRREEDDSICGTGIAECRRDEQNWEKKPSFQLLSMAQTRAIGKAFRTRFGWIASLSGYNATPAEEVDDIHVTPKEENVVEDLDAYRISPSLCASIEAKIGKEKTTNLIPALEIFVRSIVEKHPTPVTTYDVEQSALENIDRFLDGFKKFYEAQKASRVNSNSEVMKPLYQRDSKEVVDEFNALKKAGLSQWEEKHREDLARCDMFVRGNFVCKWRAIFNENYVFEQ